MSVVAEFETVVRYPDLLGESPAYDAARQRLLWTDMFGEKVRELQWVDRSGWRLGRTWEIGELTTAVVPRASGGLLIATRDAFLTLSDAGETKVLASLEGSHFAGARLNDAKCDPAGRLVAGWMAEQLDRAGEIVRLDASGNVETILSGVQLANGLDWSPDGKTMYLADSAALTVEAFDYDGSPGELGGRRTLATVERGTGAPNGVAVDDEGCVWVVITYGGELRRYSPDGALVEVVATPARRPTSCAFGGPDGRALFVTSGSLKAPPHVPERVGITPERVEAANRDEAGGALVVRTVDVAGPAAVPFAG
jgi:sugar lactone lactonase YvrE